MEKYSDLKEFEKEYDRRIEKFMSDNMETKIVFLNADFGWGKTTFIKKIKRIPENHVYSPWLNKSDNLIEDIYYYVLNKDKSNVTSKVIFLSFIIGVAVLFVNNIIQILIELFSNNTTCKVNGFLKVVCNNGSNIGLWIVLLCFIILTIAIIVSAHRYCYKKQIPELKLLKKDYGENFENILIKEIVNNIDKVLVIEDIDRCDNIEDVLIVVNKISQYIKNQEKLKKQKLDKYILIDGDYLRTINRISNSDNYSNNQFFIESYEKGFGVMEKTVSLRINFPLIKNRINSIMREKGIYENLIKIEEDEIINFIKLKYLSARFFVRFLEDCKNKIKEGKSIFHLLIDYYYRQRYFNIDNDIYKGSVFNINRFPNSMNDYEIILQKGKIKIENEAISIEDLNLKSKLKTNNEIINNKFIMFIKEKNKQRKQVFKHFYNENNIYPCMPGENTSFNNKTISIGSTLKPNLIINHLENFLVGYNNNENINDGTLSNKRCYFNANTNNNYEPYKYKNISKDSVEPIESKDDFYIAYLACFFRDNKIEMTNNYPEISKIIQKYLK